MAERSRADDPMVRTAVLRLNAATSGLGLGILLGGGLFLATIWLVVKGGPDPGRHLSLLSQFLPAYTVTVGGAFLGAFYAFVFGYCGGYFIARLYNRLAR